MSFRRPLDITLLSDVTDVDISHNDAQPHPPISNVQEREFMFQRDPDLSLTPEPALNRQVWATLSFYGIFINLTAYAK